VTGPGETTEPREADPTADAGGPRATAHGAPADAPVGGPADAVASAPAGASTDAPAARVARPWWDPRGWRWWVQVLAVYAAARAFTTVALLVTLRGQLVPNYWMPTAPGTFWQFTGLFWDADWYRQIAENGYPGQLPVGPDGLVQQNAWAFFPLFPFLVRGVMTATRLPWEVAAPCVAMLLGAAAVLVIHRLVVRGAPRAVAARPGLPLATVALVSVFPTSVVLQVGYTEALALLLIACALLAVVQRRYAWAALVVVLLGFSRAVALPMAVVVVVHALVRWRDARRGQDRLDGRDVGGLAGLAAAAAVSGVAWPLIAGCATGRSDAYLLTQQAWRGVRSTAPFEGWGYVSRFWFGDHAAIVLVASFALVVAVLVVPAAWRLGNELHAWPAAYLLYIAAAVEPGSSLARFLLLAFPLGAVTAGVVTRPASARRWWLAGVVVLMLALQLVWIWNIWRFDPPTSWPP
jgi:hypothetical protein